MQVKNCMIVRKHNCKSKGNIHNCSPEFWDITLCMVGMSPIFYSFCLHMYVMYTPWYLCILYYILILNIIMTHIEGFLTCLWWFSGAVIFICPNIWAKAQNHFALWKQINDILQVYYTSKILEKIQTDEEDVCSSSSLSTTRNLVVQDVGRI